MDVLIVKMSSLGDVIHCLPAVSDAATCVDEVRIDWLVEEGFQAIPARCRYVHEVIPIALRRWRRKWWSPSVWREMAAFKRLLQQKKYDLVIDAQGLLKSALVARLVVTRLAGAQVSGLDRDSAREPLASLLYQSRISVPKAMHATERNRRLFSSVLGYSLPEYPLKFGLQERNRGDNRQILLLHGTTWSSKEWPLSNWIRLAGIISAAGYEPSMTWGDEIEKQKCSLIASQVSGLSILPRTELGHLISQMAAMGGVVTVDTGLGHLAAGLGLPTVSIFGSTDPDLTGICGPNISILFDREIACSPCRKKRCRYKIYEDSSRIYPPCYQKITPEDVWQKLIRQMPG